MQEPERSTQLARVADFLHAQPETADGEFVLPMLTVVLRALRA
jgi:DNA-binding phage protein